MPATAPRTLATLSRWAAVAGPNAPMPASLSDLPLHQQMQLRDADPELALILSGEALPPHLEAQVLSGSWPSVAPAGPTPEEQRHQQVQSITGGQNPFHPATVNLSAQLRLEAVAPDVAAAQREAAAPALQAIAANAATIARQREQQLAESRAAHQNAMAVGAARAQLLGRG